MQITNKSLLEHKQDRYIVYSFDSDGKRSMCYGNLTIISAINEIKKYTQQCLDVLLFEFDEKRNIKVITELERTLKRRATKKEIIEFYKTMSE